MLLFLGFLASFDDLHFWLRLHQELWDLFTWEYHTHRPCQHLHSGVNVNKLFFVTVGAKCEVFSG
jgi:hypothetical protein